MIELVCQACKRAFAVYPYRAAKAQFCSNTCRNARPETTGAYKHGRSYRMLRVDGKRLYESRYVARAGPSDVVHHLNHNHHDNSPTNLAVMSRADHQRLHKVRLGTGRANR